MSDRTTFIVWRRQHSANDWIRTAHSFAAKSDKAAQARVKRMFHNAGFNSMSLVAMPEGINPNQKDTAQ